MIFKRVEDKISRWGGGGFKFLLPETEANYAPIIDVKIL